MSDQRGKLARRGHYKFPPQYSQMSAIEFMPAPIMMTDLSHTALAASRVERDVLMVDMRIEKSSTGGSNAGNAIGHPRSVGRSFL